MSWVGTWLSKYVGTWLGPTAGSGTGIVASATPLLTTLALGTVAVITGTVISAAPLQLTVTAQSPVVKVGARTIPLPLSTLLNLNTPTTSASVVVNPVGWALQVAVPSAQVYTSIINSAAPLIVNMAEPAAVVSTGAITVTTTLELVTIVTDASIYTGAYCVALPSDIIIVVVSGVVYDKTGTITYTKAATMRVNLPEIIAFSTDYTTDMQVVEAMEDDMASMDGTQSVKLLRKTDNVVIDFKLGTAIPENKIYTFEHALIRQIAERDNRAVKQLRLFMQSVQNDEFTTLDTIIELPRRDDVQIKSGDQIQSDLQGTLYTVIAVDDCTLKTRWRIGARRIV